MQPAGLVLRITLSPSPQPGETVPQPTSPQFVQSLPATTKARPNPSWTDSLLATFLQLSTVPKIGKVPCALTPKSRTSSPVASTAASSPAAARQVTLLRSAPIAIPNARPTHPVGAAVAFITPPAPRLSSVRGDLIVMPKLVLPPPAVHPKPLALQAAYAEYEAIDLNGDSAKMQQLLIRLFQHEGQGSLNFNKLPGWLKSELVEKGDTISTLDISSLAINKADIEALATYFIDLRCVTLCAKNLTDADLATVTQLRTLTHLKVVQGNALTPSLLNALKLPRLQILEIDAANGQLLEGDYPTEAATDAIQSLLHEHENLTKVRVGQYEKEIMRLDDATFQETMQTERDRLDIDFDFACQQLSDTSLQFIGATLTRVKRIALFGCRHFTDAGLAALKALPALTELEMYGAERITAAAIADFKAHFVTEIIDVETQRKTLETSLQKCVITKDAVPAP